MFFLSRCVVPGDFQFVAEGGETNERTDTAKKAGGGRRD